VFVVTRFPNRNVILLFEYFGYSTAELLLLISVLFLVAEARSLKEGREELDLKK